MAQSLAVRRLVPVLLVFAFHFPQEDHPLAKANDNPCSTTHAGSQSINERPNPVTFRPAGTRTRHGHHRKQLACDP